MQCPHCHQQLPASAITPTTCPSCGQPFRGQTMSIELPDLKDILPPEIKPIKRLPTATLQPNMAIELPPLGIDPIDPQGASAAIPTLAPNSAAAIQLPDLQEDTAMPVLPVDNEAAVVFPDMAAPMPATPVVPKVATIPPPPAIPKVATIPPPPAIPRVATIPPPPAIPKVATIPPPPVVPRVAPNKPAAAAPIKPLNAVMLPDLSAAASLTGKEKPTDNGAALSPVNPIAGNGAKSIELPDLSVNNAVKSDPLAGDTVRDLPPMAGVSSSGSGFGAIELPDVSLPVSNSYDPLSADTIPDLPPAKPAAVALPDLSALATPEPAAVALPDLSALATPEPAAVALPDLSALATPEPAAVALPDLSALATPDSDIMLPDLNLPPLPGEDLSVPDVPTAGANPIALPDMPPPPSGPSFIADLPLPAITTQPEEAAPVLDLGLLMGDNPAITEASDLPSLPDNNLISDSARLDLPGNLVESANNNAIEDINLPGIPDVAENPSQSMDLLDIPNDILPNDAPSLLDGLGAIGEEDVSAPSLLESSLPDSNMDFAVERTSHESGDSSFSAPQLDASGNIELDNSATSIQLDLVAKPANEAVAEPIKPTRSAIETAPTVRMTIPNQVIQPTSTPVDNAQATKKSSSPTAFLAFMALLAAGGVAMEYTTPYGYFGYKFFSDSLNNEVALPVVSAPAIPASADSVSDAATEAAIAEEADIPAEPVVKLPERGQVPHISVEKLPAFIEDLSTSKEDPAIIKPVLIDALWRGYVTLGNNSYKKALLDELKNDRKLDHATMVTILSGKGKPDAQLKQMAKDRRYKQLAAELTYYSQLQQKAYPKALTNLKALCRKSNCRDAAISYLRQAPAKGPASYMAAFSSLPAALKADGLIRVLVAHRLEKDKEIAKVGALLDTVTLPQKELMPTDRSWLTMRDVDRQIVNGHLRQAQTTISNLLKEQPDSVMLQSALGDIAMWLHDYNSASAIFSTLGANEENLNSKEYQAKAWFALIMAGDLEATKKELGQVSTNDKKLPQYKLAETWLKNQAQALTKEEKSELSKLFNKYPEVTSLAMHYRPLVDLMEDNIVMANNKPWSSQIQTQVRQLEFFSKKHMPVKAKEKVSQMNPANYHLVNPVDLRNAMANYLIMMGHSNEALQQIAPVIADLPDDVTLLTTQARAMAILGQHLEAAKIYEKAAKLQNNVMDLLLAAAKEYLIAGDANSSLVILNDLSEHNVANEQILYLLARSWLETDHNKARRYITEAIQLNGKEAKYYTILGICEAKNGRTNDAIKNYKQALQLDPQDRLALRKIAEISMEEETFTSAIGYYEKLAKLIPGDASIYANIAKAHTELDQTEKAVAAYVTANKLAPNDTSIMISLAKLYQEQNKGAEAQRLYERAIRVDPQNSAAFLQLGYFYKEQGLDRKAVEMFRKFLNLAPEAEEAREVTQEIEDLSK